MSDTSFACINNVRVCIAGMGAGVRGGSRASSGWLIGDGSEDLSQEEAISRLIASGEDVSAGDADKAAEADSDKVSGLYRCQQKTATATNHVNDNSHSDLKVPILPCCAVFL